jgi:hypothetical protein
VSLDIKLLTERKQQLNNQLEQQQNIINQAIANVNAINGAIQECDYWVEQIEKSEIKN